MKNKMLIILFACVFGFVACSENKKKDTKTVTREVVKPVVEPDSIPPTIEPEPVMVTKGDNKYFLIKASFSNEANAVAYRNQLISEGYDSEVIIRQWGANRNFYKVSYKGFTDKNEAFKYLAQEKRQVGHEDVWLLVKR